MVLEVKNLSYAYGNKCVLTDVSFSISEGDFLSVLGPNGAGKAHCSNVFWVFFLTTKE